MTAAPADAQRERAVDVLRRAYADGRLELDQFEARVGAALSARSTAGVQLQLRGLHGDELRRRARRAAQVAAAIAVWSLLSLFLAIGCIVALVTTHASVWTLAFPAVWVAVTWLAVRELRHPR